MQVDVGAGEITLTGNSNLGQSYLFQRIERLFVAQYTISILFEGNTSIVALSNNAVDRGIVQMASTESDAGLLSLTWRQDVETDYNQGYLRIHCPGRAKILAAKLELGPTQTLAHREGDKWVLNEVPDYGEQLRRCLRYARSLRGNSKSAYCQLATGVATSSTKATLYVPLAQPLRTGPAITSTGDFRIVARGGQVITVTGFDFALGEWSGSIVRFGVSVAGGLTAGDFVVLQPNNDASADILLSADL